LAVPDENARVLYEPWMIALAFAREDFRFGQLLVAPGLVTAEQKEREQGNEDPELGRAFDLLFFFPTEKAGGNEERHRHGDNQGESRLRVLGHGFSVLQNSGDTADEISRRNELGNDGQPGGHDRERKGRAAEKE